jgi:hypothetical protein
MEELQKWFDQEFKPSTWECPSCKKVLPSGIVGISDHWSKCGGKTLYDKIVKVFDDKESKFSDLKEVLDEDYFIQLFAECADDTIEGYDSKDDKSIEIPVMTEDAFILVMKKISAKWQQ